MKRMLACLFITAVLPLMASTTQKNATNSVPFATIAYAGHSLVGGNYCECGTPGCLPDPGEDCGMDHATVVGKNDRSLNQSTTSAHADRNSRFDFASSTLMIALAFFLWTRLRA